MERAEYYEGLALETLQDHDDLPTNDVARPEFMARAQVYATLAQAAAQAAGTEVTASG